MDKDYKDGYENGYADAIRAMQDKKRKCWQWVLQRLIGIIIFVMTIFLAWINDGDATIAIITIPLGCLFLFSKELLWEDKDEE